MKRKTNRMNKIFVDSDWQITRFSIWIDEHLFRWFLHHSTTSVDRSFTSCGVFSVSKVSRRIKTKRFFFSFVQKFSSHDRRLWKWRSRSWWRSLRSLVTDGFQWVDRSKLSFEFSSFVFQDQEERLMHLHQLADCLLLFKRTMGSIETLQKEDVISFLFPRNELDFFFVFFRQLFEPIYKK